MVIYMYAACTDGDVRLVDSSDGTLSTIVALRAENQAEVCWNAVNASEILRSDCRRSWNDTIEGRVEICQGNMFGTVCDDRWDRLEAMVVCRQLKSTTDGNSL